MGALAISQNDKLVAVGDIDGCIKIYEFDKHSEQLSEILFINQAHC